MKMVSRSLTLFVVLLLTSSCDKVLGIDFGAAVIAGPDASLDGASPTNPDVATAEGGLCSPQTCPELGYRCGTQDDGCHDAINCGGCGASNACINGQCVCQPRTCADQAASCGTVPDGCGGTYDCGTCPASSPNCGGGGANVCGVTACVPATCAGACGPISDGCGNVLDCGSCMTPDTCGGGAAAHECGCTPFTCAERGASCGAVPDGCGGTLSCGACAGTCTNNVCSVCTPKTCQSLGKNCGSLGDGCGGTLSCGTCASESCIGNVCGGCTPATCQSLGKNCGSPGDGCGGTLICGSCISPATCGGSGVADVCGGGQTAFTVGGNLSGLVTGSALLLQDNGGSNLLLTENGSFLFAATVASGTAYDVTVLAQPSAPAQSCFVSMGAGTADSANVTNVQVTCTTVSFTVGGTLIGLASGSSITLQDNGGDDLTLSSNGAFSFPTSLASGKPFAVTLLTENPPQSCAVSAGTGTVGNGNVTTIVVNCSASSVGYTVGGSVVGLSPNDSLAVENNGTTSQFLSANGSFAFTTPLPSGATYDVTVVADPVTPVSEKCTVASGTGTIGAANVTNVMIACAPLTSCLALLQARPGSANGIYSISIKGVPYSVYCDMVDGGWTQVLDQDLSVAPQYQTISAWLAGVNTGQPNSGQYSILNEIPNLSSGPSYEFWINWPVAPQMGSVSWTQVENPLTSSQTPTISNVAEVPAGQTGCGTFRGLATSINGQPAALHGDSSYTGCWWWAIGQSATWDNGIPGYSLPGTGNGTTHAQLWER